MKGSINIQFSPVEGEENTACNVSVASDLQDFESTAFCDAIATAIAHASQSRVAAGIFSLCIADLAMKKAEEKEDASECHGG